MTTPEKKVKDKVKAFLKEQGAYFFMPATGGYGKSGVPDLVACIKGRFIGIECKANGNKPTALQLKNLVDIATAGGVAFVVDDQTIEMFKNTFNLGLPEQGVVFDLLGETNDGDA
jgi:Holliday junction resolvase